METGHWNERSPVSGEVHHTGQTLLLIWRSRGEPTQLVVLENITFVCSIHCQLPNIPYSPDISALLYSSCTTKWVCSHSFHLSSVEEYTQCCVTCCVCVFVCVCVQVVEFYVSQSQAANHAVREAACTCIAELGTKVTISCLSLLFEKINVDLYFVY